MWAKGVGDRDLEPVEVSVGSLRGGPCLKNKL